MIYILSVFKSMPDEALQYSRLYAYPAVPVALPGHVLVLMDSGAFALSKLGRVIDDDYMRGLAAHYRQYATHNCLAIAPDQYLSPRRSMNNFEAWQARYGIAVVPVLQCEHKRHLAFGSLMQQVRWYAANALAIPRWQGRPVVAFSNPGLKAAEVAPHALKLRRLIEDRFGAEVWLHNLGAGWDIEDVRGYRRMKVFDSIDSIAYYTSAQAGISWLPRLSSSDWRTQALLNAHAANETHVTSPQN